MLIRKKRIIGNLNGLGYINPYTLPRNPEIVQPVDNEDFRDYLLALSSDADTMNRINDKQMYLNQTHSKYFAMPTNVSNNQREFIPQVTSQQNVPPPMGQETPMAEQPTQMANPQLGSGAPTLPATMCGGDSQYGQGIADSIQTAQKAYTTAQLIYDGVKQAKDWYQSEQGIAARNFYGKHINPTGNWRPDFPGELHALDTSGNTFNYLGPGTKIAQRIARGDPPLDGSNGLDAQARKHDIAYANARSLDDVRQADQQFVRDVNSSTASGFKKKLVSGAMLGKMKAEKAGFLDPNRFSKIANLRDAPNVQAGQGMTRVKAMGKYPDSYIRNKLMKKYKNKRR